MTDQKFEMFQNRLLKNYKHRLKQAKRLNVTCWRLYDHDLPEFPICVEFYEDYIYIAEYNRRHSLTDEEHDLWFVETKRIISEMTGATIEFLTNPRFEAEENDLHVENKSLINFGLSPITLNKGLMLEVHDIASKYKDRCDLSKIPATSLWRSNH